MSVKIRFAETELCIYVGNNQPKGNREVVSVTLISVLVSQGKYMQDLPEPKIPTNKRKEKQQANTTERALQIAWMIKKNCSLKSLYSVVIISLKKI